MSNNKNKRKTRNKKLKIKKQQEAYKIMCDKYKSSIDITFCGENIKYHNNDDSGLLELIINNNSVLTIVNNREWDDLKRNIQNCLNRDRYINDDNNKCPICFKGSQIIILCSKCSSPYCIDCHINVFKNNNGVISCPFCRNITGEYLPNRLIPLGIENIIKRIKRNIHKTNV